MELDEKRICTSELWQRQIIIASRQKRPASFGFYSPARDGAKLEGSINTKRVSNSFGAHFNFLFYKRPQFCAHPDMPIAEEALTRG